ncbi:MAG TPA: SCE4755 family polysaccharide monooxygenase-like protein [Candidatus Nanopelagicales bacterium]|nr:SCE4755 family polysaccharide monooxygenase-like protein [Candidatus Nanopelagicales bacterium]
MRRLLIGSLAFATTLSAAAVTQAHIELVMPPPRHLYQGGPEQKTGPCGMANSVRGSTITTYEPGATITVSWQEPVDHPAHYRILFAADGSAFPDPVSETDFCTPGQELTPGSGIWCLADNIPDMASNANNMSYSTTATLPDVTCDNCTLQLVQWMNGAAAGQELYYKCADLVLSSGGAGGAGGAGGVGGSASTTTTGAGGGATSTGTGTGGADNAPANEYDPYPRDSSCAFGRGHGTSAAFALGSLGLLAFLGRRRRRAPH